ncbi:MAG: hypothetical protein WCK31_04270 [bacterium]
MNRLEFNQNRIIRLIKEGFKEKPALSVLRRKNLDKIVGNTIELASQKQRNVQLDRTVNKLVQQAPKRGFIGLLSGIARWQIAMLSIFVLVFVTSGVALANPSIGENIKTALAIETGTIEISSNVIDSNVFLRNINEQDFKQVGTTNLTLNKIPSGDYEFYVQKEGYIQSNIIRFSLNSGKFYNKYVSLEEDIADKNVKSLDYTNSEFGIYLKYPETATPIFEKYSDDSFKLSIKASDSIFVLQSQETQPTLVPNYKSEDIQLSKSNVGIRRYAYKNVSDTFSKDSTYKYGVSTNGLFQINNISYFLYSESISETNTLFDSIIKNLALTKTKVAETTYKQYKFSDSKLGISFSYYDDFIYSTEINTSNEYKVKLENKNNKDIVIRIHWKVGEFGQSDPINFSSSNNQNISQTTINSTLAYSLTSQAFEIAYLLPNNTAIYASKINSDLVSVRLLKQKELLLSTFQSSNLALPGIIYPYQVTSSNTTSSMPTSLSSSSATSSYKAKD